MSGPEPVEKLEEGHKLFDSVGVDLEENGVSSEQKVEETV